MKEEWIIYKNSPLFGDIYFLNDGKKREEMIRAFIENNSIENSVLSKEKIPIYKSGILYIMTVRR